MRRIKVIFNPMAHRGDNHRRYDFFRALLDEHAGNASDNGSAPELHWSSTERPGHATELAHEAALAGYDAVIAIGGDGTVHEVVNGLMQVIATRRPRLGILPTGTGNDLANNFGLATDLSEAARRLFRKDVRPLDIGMVTDADGYRKYWANTLGFGFSGAVTVVARSSQTILRGFALYLYIVLKTILLHAQNLDIQVAMDGAEPVERSVSMANICNGRGEGGGFPVAPHAEMDDGLISYTFMRRMNRLQMLYFLPIVLSARHVERTKFFEFGTARTLRIESRHPLIVHVDGEMFSQPDRDLHRMEATMIPAALRVLGAANGAG